MAHARSGCPEDNIHLIAADPDMLKVCLAAPDLLEACEIAYRQLMGRFTSEDMAAKRIILAAIDKARGEAE